MASYYSCYYYWCLILATFGHTMLEGPVHSAFVMGLDGFALAMISGCCLRASNKIETLVAS